MTPHAYALGLLSLLCWHQNECNCSQHSHITELLYAVRACNITSAEAVDREFVYIYWARLDPNVFQFASNWSRIGSNWVPSGLHLDPRGSHWPLLGPHWEPGPVWEPRELSSAMPAHKVCVLGTRRGIHGTEESGGRTRGSDPHPTRAGGQDDGSYTNSLKQLITACMNHQAFPFCGRMCRTRCLVKV